MKQNYKQKNNTNWWINKIGIFKKNLYKFKEKLVRYEVNKCLVNLFLSFSWEQVLALWAELPQKYWKHACQCCPPPPPP